MGNAQDADIKCAQTGVCLLLASGLSSVAAAALGWVLCMRLYAVPRLVDVEVDFYAVAHIAREILRRGAIWPAVICGCVLALELAVIVVSAKRRSRGACCIAAFGATLAIAGLAICGSIALDMLSID